MTNHWSDIPNADVILIMGANPASNHPASFGHITDGLDQGTKLIVVDPLYTRSAMLADLYVPMRPGTDIAFLGGMIHYILTDMEANPDNYNWVYISNYTNASFLLNPEFQGPSDLDGVFSGFGGEGVAYDKATWKFQVDEAGIPIRDMTLKDPNCVFQILKRHYARYDADTVSQITGSPKEKFLEVARLMAETGKVGKAATIMYAMGWTQHTHGTQNIRAASIMQLLLANIGVAGGGINALRGESNVQGSTDHALLFNVLPGYLKVPISADETLAAHIERSTPKTSDPLSANWLQNYSKYIVSMLKAWYGEAATAENDFGFHYLGKIEGSKDYSWLSLFAAMEAGKIEGLMIWGQNPAVCSPESLRTRDAMHNLKWMVAVDLFETESSVFWKRPNVNPSDVQTEVFLLPAACSYEKEGSITNSGRMSQWRYKAVEPVGEAKTDLWMITQITHRLQALYAEAGGPNADALTKLTWNYGDEEPSAQLVSKEINGYAITDQLTPEGKVEFTAGQQLSGFAKLKNDGSTASGNWLYCGHHTQDGNLTERRDLTDPTGIKLFPNFAWTWPANRRIIYNRASVDLDGNPWDKEHPVIWWDAAAAKWLGDVPDGGMPPMNVDPKATKLPFIMQKDGVASIFGPGLKDGPFPEHYEPWESPVENLLSKIQANPHLTAWGEPVRGDREKYPVIGTTYRLTEHWLSGAMTRNIPWLVELFPDMFVELGPELAKERGISNGAWVIIQTARGELKARAVVTKRVQSLKIRDKMVHQIAIPWHWGYMGRSQGESANLLTPAVGDANTAIPEYKAFLCDVRAA